MLVGEFLHITPFTESRVRMFSVAENGLPFICPCSI